MSIKWALLVSLLLINCRESSGQDKYLLEGKIGPYPIIMKVEESLNFRNGDNIEIFYYYKRDKHDIELYGHTLGIEKYLFEKRLWNSKTERDEITEKFLLERLPNKNWKGEWVNSSGKELPVNLHPLDTLTDFFKNLPDFNYQSKIDRSYTGYRLNDLQFVNDSITRQGNYVLEWNHEVNTHIVSFRIKSGPEEVILKKINTLLSKKQYSYIENFFSCAGTHIYNGDYSYHLLDYFITENFLSINGFLSYYCGGFHPDFGEENIIVNMKTGEEIKDLDMLFWFTGKMPVNEKEVGYYDYIEERSKVILNILTKLYPERMKKRKTQDSCDYSNSYVWNFPSWRFSKKGLYIGAFFARAARVCDSPDFSYIPYDILRKFIRKDQQIQLP